MQRLYKFLQIFLLITFLTGCGFHLRDRDGLPPALNLLYLKSSDPYSTFILTLRHYLTSLNITIVDQPDQAPITLEIVDAHFGYTTSTIGPSSQSRVYYFTYSASFRLTNPVGNVIVPLHTVSAHQSLTLDPNELLESNNQMHLLKQTMQQSLINQIYYQLSARQVTDTLAHEFCAPHP